MDKLGIEPSLLLAQIVNFTVIMVVLQKLLYKPIIGMLEKRKKTIEEGLRLTEAMKEEQAKLEVKKEKILASAKEEGNKIVEDAKKRAQEEVKEILAQGRVASEEIIAKGKKDIASEKEDMKKHVKEEAITLATIMAKRLLQGVLSAEMQHKLIASHTKELSHMEA